MLPNFEAILVKFREEQKRRLVDVEVCLQHANVFLNMLQLTPTAIVNWLGQLTSKPTDYDDSLTLWFEQVRVSFFPGMQRIFCYNNTLGIGGSNLYMLGDVCAFVQRNLAQNDAAKKEV